MADQSKIEWTDATWNVVNGCALISEGCKNCYAANLAATRLKNHPRRAGLARKNRDGVAKFTGEVRFNEKALTDPLRWRRPRKIFVCAHGDLFHESVPDSWIDHVFAVMALCPQHVFQVLTKRPDRMRAYFKDQPRARRRWEDILRNDYGVTTKSPPIVLPNVWLGVSVEDQTTADARIPALLETPAAVRFLSAEPLLGPIDLNEICRKGNGGGHVFSALRCDVDPEDDEDFGGQSLDWVIVGGESGHHARPMHPDWVRSLRDQCAEAHVPFLFKQWGAWAPHIGAVDGWSLPDNPEISRYDHLEFDPGEGSWGEAFRPMWSDWDALDPAHVVSRVGKKAAGRVLDGVLHDGFPQGAQ